MLLLWPLILYNALRTGKCPKPFQIQKNYLENWKTHSWAKEVIKYFSNPNLEYSILITRQILLSDPERLWKYYKKKLLFNGKVI